ncbi:MAG: helix-turn-helix domain-containing protein [Saprospiraceae bacterium]|nr:helix-turn-helix domain-containing protein [Saprospiraceae bacterium]
MDNPELILANEFVLNTNKNIFLTGKAGTGKTTFLKKLSNSQFKRNIVVAPTGVAAINAHGVTIHSFFQIPFGPLVPGTNEEVFFQRKMRSSKINIIKSLDLLIIDEISMVRADLLDGIDTVLRRYRDRSKPFGGVQLLMIGDIYQLAPVTKAEEWNLLAPYYETPYFFSSNSFRQAEVITIELTRIFRQDNKDFIRILEKVRNNDLDTETLKELNLRYSPDAQSIPGDGYITLTTHNARAESMNEHELDKLVSASTYYKAVIKDNFPEYSYPTLEKLEFKIGAQVMFVKNDPSGEKVYYNGKIGKITGLKKDSVTVLGDGDDEETEVSRLIWENISYTLNRENQNIEEEVLGSFEQIPLKLAWAITIHKSQGLTFDKAIIDAQSSFAHGQTYVALSRCRTLEGIILKTKINLSSVISDQRISSFTHEVKSKMPDEKFLSESKRTFQLMLIKELFDFEPLINPVRYAKRIAENNQKVLIGNHKDILFKLNVFADELINVGKRFEEQIGKHSPESILPENDTFIIERVSKAVDYYLNFTEQNMRVLLSTLAFTTDNKEVKKDFSRQVDNINSFVNRKIFCYKGLGSGFTVLKYLELRAKSNISAEEKKTADRDFVRATDHPVLFNKLRDYRFKIAEDEQIDHYQVFTQATLYEICEKLPVNLRLLKKINGIGKVRLKLYGEDIVMMIRQYCTDNNIKMPEEEDPYTLTKPPEPGTYQKTIDLFRSGKKPDEIARERNLALSTIEGHLAKFILSGEISIFDVIAREKYDDFVRLTANKKFENLTELKALTGNTFSFGELRMLINHRHSEEGFR